MNVELNTTKALEFDPKLIPTHQVPLTLVVPEAPKGVLRSPSSSRAKIVLSKSKASSGIQRSSQNSGASLGRELINWLKHTRVKWLGRSSQMALQCVRY